MNFHLSFSVSKSVPKGAMSWNMVTWRRHLGSVLCLFFWKQRAEDCHLGLVYPFHKVNIGVPMDWCVNVQSLTNQFYLRLLSTRLNTHHPLFLKVGSCVCHHKIGDATSQTDSVGSTLVFLLILTSRPGILNHLMNISISYCHAYINVIQTRGGNGLKLTLIIQDKVRSDEVAWLTLTALPRQLE
jgi:hypothetical protein